MSMCEIKMQPWQVFHAARKVLGANNVARIFNREIRSAHNWAQDPAHTECRCRSPLELLHTLFERMDAAGIGYVARSGIGVKLDQYGNVSIGQIRQILSVLGRAETAAGYMANITNRSRRRNTRQRDYVVIDGRQPGHLPQGVYQRFQTGAGFGAKTKRTILDRSKAYQKGSRKIAVRDPRTGRIVRWESVASRMQSIVRARGLRPVLLVGRTGHQVKPLLDFYGVAGRVFHQRFEPLFWDTLNAFLRS